MLCHVPKLKEKEEQNEVKKINNTFPSPLFSFSPFKGDYNLLKIW